MNTENQNPMVRQERLEKLNALPVHRRAAVFRVLRECWDAGELNWEPGWLYNMITDVTTPTIPTAEVRAKPASTVDPPSNNIGSENPVNSKQARKELGWGETMMSAVKKAMGIKGRYFFLSDVRRWMREHPEFRTRDVYPHWNRGLRTNGASGSEPLSASAESARPR